MTKAMSAADMVVGLKTVNRTAEQFDDEMRHMSVGASISGGWLVVVAYHRLMLEWCRLERMPWRFDVRFPHGMPVVVRVS